MESPTKPDQSSRFIAAGCILLLGAAGTCALIAGQIAFDSAGGIWGWVTELFRRNPPEGMTLARALETGAEAAFRLGEPCNFLYTQGNAISSAAETQGREGFSRDLSRSEVTGVVMAFLEGETLQTKDGELSLVTGEPVDVDLLGEGRIALRFTKQSATAEGSQVESLEGAAERDAFRGSYHLDQNISTVENGQGLEEATNMVAEFSCTLAQVDH